MARNDGMIFCDRCGVEITWAPVLVAPKPEDGPDARTGEFCCEPCALGLGCSCAEHMFEADDDQRRNPYP
jgi:hypothetical protein